MRLADLWGEYHAMRDMGWYHADIAHALGIKPESLTRALQRYRARRPEGTGSAGDPTLRP